MKTFLDHACLKHDDSSIIYNISYAINDLSLLSRRDIWVQLDEAFQLWYVVSELIFLCLFKEIFDAIREHSEVRCEILSVIIR